MYKIYSFSLLLILSMLLMRCSEDAPPNASELGDKIMRVTFGTGWDGVQKELTDTTRVFDAGTSIVYYEIYFKETFSAGGMIKKLWQIPSESDFETTSFILKNTKRICGEFHKYDTQDMTNGTYNISVSWYNSASAIYVEYACTTGVDCSFRIGQ